MTPVQDKHCIRLTQTTAEADELRLLRPVLDFWGESYSDQATIAARDNVDQRVSRRA
jgi:hypothetical protein